MLYGAGTPSNLAIMGGINSMIWRKALILVGVTLLAMTGIGLIVILLFFLGKRMMTMMADDGRCSCMGPGERRYHE